MPSEDASNDSLSAAALARLVWRDFLRARRALIMYDILVKLAQAWLLAPLLTLVLAGVLALGGRQAVSNLDIANFLLSPLGLIYAALVATIALASLFFEQGGLMVLTALKSPNEQPTISRMTRTLLANLAPAFRLGGFVALFLAIGLAPLLLIGLAAYYLLLTRYDIYFYLNERPTEFWAAAAVGTLLAIAAIKLLSWLYVRWSLALPIVVFEGQTTRAALRASGERVNTQRGRVSFILIGWLVAGLLLGIGLEAAFRWLAATILERAGERPVVVVVVLLLGQVSLMATWAFIVAIGHALLLRRLYLLLDCPEAGQPAANEERPIPPWSWRLQLLAWPLFLLAPLILWLDLSRYAADGPQVAITAHRGHARAAPENTLSAVRKAIDAGADFAEIDVQLTADGKVVLLHDRDLKRVSGDSRRLADLTFAELQQLDVGSWFGPQFAGERAPTLAEVIDVARGRIKLNIELKVFGPERQVARNVAKLLHTLEFDDQCIVTCCDLEALAEVKRHNPKLRTGLIVAQSLGDVSRLDLAVLSVRADFLTDRLLRAAHRRGLEVHVWTVNDPNQMLRLMQRGVDNILTSDPDLALQTRQQWTDLPAGDRLVLAARLLLGLEPT